MKSSRLDDTDLGEQVLVASNVGRSSPERLTLQAQNASTYETQVPRRESGVGVDGNELSHQDTTTHHPPPLLILNPIAAAAASSAVDDSFSCPLQYEMEKLQNERERASETYESVVARIRADRDKLIEVVNASHNLLFHLLEEKLGQEMKESDAKLSKIKAASVLAEVLRRSETESLPDEVQRFSPREAAAPVIDPQVQHLQTTLSAADVRHYRPPSAPVRPANDRMTHFPGQLHNESPLVGESQHYPWGNADVNNVYQARPTDPHLQNTGLFPFPFTPPPPSMDAPAVQTYQQSDGDEATVDSRANHFDNGENDGDEAALVPR